MPVRLDLGELSFELLPARPMSDRGEIRPGDVCRELRIGLHTLFDERTQQRITVTDVLEQSAMCALLCLRPHAVEHARIDTLNHRIGRAPQQWNERVLGQWTLPLVLADRRRGVGVKPDHEEGSNLAGRMRLPYRGHEVVELGRGRETASRIHEGQQHDLGIGMLGRHVGQPLCRLGRGGPPVVDPVQGSVDASLLPTSARERAQPELFDHLDEVPIVNAMDLGLGPIAIAVGRIHGAWDGTHSIVIVPPDLIRRRYGGRAIVEMSVSERAGRQRREQRPAQKLGEGLKLLLGLLVAYRLVYHSYYVREVPFALATFSDGRHYELAALDILAHPPLGSEPFYLQGLYAYVMALPMAIEPWPSLALLFQLVLASLALWGFFRAAQHWLGRRDAGWSLALLLAYPMLAFYENKFLTAALAVGASVAVLLALARLETRGSAGRLLVLGLATGLAVLARPNFLLVAPFVLWAVIVLARLRGASTWRWAGLAALGVVLAIAPMVLRNAAVTGQPTFVPTHGGGTSFYIGNNARARGVWNDAGGLLTGDIGQERAELLDELGITGPTQAERTAQIGWTLYRRAFTEIADDPAGWIWLELRKLWLLVGNDELVQDYDLHGEQELLPFAHRVGLPFGLLFVLGAAGLLHWNRLRRTEPNKTPVFLVALGLVLATVAANVVYFTSAQHRLPLVVPLCLFAIPGARAVMQARRERKWLPVAIAVAVLLATLVPRSKKTRASAVHDYNLAVAWLRLDQPLQARAALDRALDRRPDHPVILVERASLARARGDYDTARRDLEHLARIEDPPRWVSDKADRERVLLFRLTGRP